MTFKKYCRVSQILLVIGMSILAGQLAQGAISTKLKVSSVNPRYMDNGGTPVVLLGSGCPLSSVKGHDYRGDVDALAAANVNYTRVWHILPWGAKDCYFPWSRSGGGTAKDGLAKYDLTKWDSNYWTRLKDLCAYAQSKNLYLSIILFDECGMEAYDGDHRWDWHPFNPSNNINGLSLPTSDAIPEFYDLNNSKLKSLQELYVAKMITETSGYPNVLYEICNELTGSWTWEKYWIDYVRARCSNVISVNRLGSVPSNYWTDSRIGIVNFHWGTMDPASVNSKMVGYTTNSSYMKAINYDEPIEDSGQSTSTYRRVAWAAFVGGGHLHHEAYSTDSKPNDAIKYLMGFIKSNGVKFWEMSPRNSLVTSDPGGTAYTLAKPGSEYVVYIVGSGSGSMTISLASGVSYTAKAYNPSNGSYTNLTVNGNTISGIPSYSTDMVVYIKASGTPSTATPNITLTLAADKSQAVPGDTVTYTLTYKNTGNGEAKTVSITNPVPTYTTYVSGSATSSGVYDSSARKVTWNIASVAAGASGTVSFKVKID